MVAILLVEIVARAAGAKADTLALHINTENPTVSTTSEAFLRSASGGCRMGRSELG